MERMGGEELSSYILLIRDAFKKRKTGSYTRMP